METRKSCSRDGHPKGRYTRVWGEESPTPWETPQPPPGDVWSHPVQGIDTLETGRALVHTSPLLSHICLLLTKSEKFPLITTALEPPMYFIIKTVSFVSGNPYGPRGVLTDFEVGSQSV